jgi:hypothetical protein
VIEALVPQFTREQSFPTREARQGQNSVLTGEEAGDPLRSIETDNVVGLRDRALIGVIIFTFARISAANVADIFHQLRRLWVRLHEKGGKLHEMPCDASASTGRLVSGPRRR